MQWAAHKLILSVVLVVFPYNLNGSTYFHAASFELVLDMFHIRQTASGVSDVLEQIVQG
jgi:hypothetical protein